MFGNWATGRVTIVITPTITSTIEITIATIGRLIKNFDIPLTAFRFASGHKGFWIHQPTGMNLLHPLGDNAFTRFQPILNNPHGASQLSYFNGCLLYTSPS